MPKEKLTYVQQTDRATVALTRKMLPELPPVCTDFVRGIEPTTQPKTRYQYVRDLRIFFHFLSNEIPEFGGFTPGDFDSDALNRITARHLEMFMEYLSLYVLEDDTAITNADRGKMRKLAAIRAFYHYLFKHEIVAADISTLVDMPKIHDKPILRMEIDEVSRMLDAVESGELLSEGQKRYHEQTKVRDMAILTLFLGTGIRVSELVGINIKDLDFTVNGFLVTRKGGSQAVLYYPDEVADVLKTYLQERKTVEALPGHEDALFLSLQKKRIGVRAVEKMVKKYATSVAPLKKRLSPHKLRSTFGTNLYHETGDIYVVADVLGHSDVNTTRRYYAAMTDDKRRMAAKSVHLRDDKPQKP